MKVGREARGLYLRSRRAPPGPRPGCACAGARQRRGSRALPGEGALLGVWKMKEPARIREGASMKVGREARGLYLRSRRAPPGRRPGCACAGARQRRGSRALPGEGALLRVWENEGASAHPRGCLDEGRKGGARALFALTARTARPEARLRLRGRAPKARVACAPGCRRLAEALENEGASAHPRGCLDEGRKGGARALFALTARTARPEAGLRLRGRAPKRGSHALQGVGALLRLWKKEGASAHPPRVP